MNRISLYILLLFSMASCQKENMGDCFKSTGKTVEDQRSLAGFHSISIQDGIHLYLTQAPHFSVLVSAGKNLQSNIETKVDGQVLKIQNKNKCNWVRSYKREIKVYVSLPDLKEIDYNGSSNVYFQNTFHVDQIFIDMFNASGSIQTQLDCKLAELKVHSGPGDIYAAGSADEVVLFNGGNGNLEALNLVATSGLVVNENTGKIKTSIVQNLKAEIYGSGSIFLQGTPQIELIREGKGNLEGI